LAEEVGERPGEIPGEEEVGEVILNVQK